MGEDAIPVAFVCVCGERGLGNVVKREGGEEELVCCCCCCVIAFV